METQQPNFLKPIGVAVLLFSVCPAMPTNAATVPADTLARQEAQRRANALEESRELLRKGDQSYEKGSYADAIQAYSGARELLGSGPAVAEWKSTATDRLAQASVAHARDLARKGDLKTAKQTVNEVLKPDVAPNHPLALACRAELDDPIRYNPASSSEHTQNIETVRRALYTAEGAYNLGKFDDAVRSYQEVLRVDPTNIAARRGLEAVSTAKSSSSASTYDHTRAEALSQVDAVWELPLAPVEAPTLAPDGSPDPSSSAPDLATKIERILIPKVSLDQVSLPEALDFLRVRARENDTTELDPDLKGVNLTLNLGDPSSDAVKRILNSRFDLQLAQVPLSAALKYVTDLTHTTYSIDGFAVVIRAGSANNAELVSRTYRVPPDFISALSAGAASAAPADPFADNASSASQGLLTSRLSAQDALARQGVSFPQGASASFRPGSNTLIVTNTAVNQDIVQQIVEAQTQSEPAVVTVEVTMIRTQMTNLEELGFDWLVNPTEIDSSKVFAAGGTQGNTGGRTGADFASADGTLAAAGATPGDATSNVTKGVMTNGLRSGDQAVGGNAIDSVLGGFTRSSQVTRVAPGALAVTGTFHDASTVQMMMRALSQKKSVDLVSKPSVVSRSGQSTTIQMVREFIYPTEYEPPELPNNVGSSTGGSFPVTPAHPTSFSTKNVGMSLEVLPVVDPEKRYIEVTLNPSMVDFDGFVNYGSPITSYAQATTAGVSVGSTIEVSKNAILMPVFSTQRTNTQVTVADGATIVIAGMLQDQVENVEDKVPLFGDLPWVGRLFTSKASERVAKAVLFLVHVRVTDPTGMSYRVP